jgi:hypothetical protein
MISKVAAGRAPHNIVVSVVIVENGNDTVTLPRMAKASGPLVAQLVRPADTAVTVTQSSATVAATTNTSGSRKEILLVSYSDDPIPNPAGDGA